MDVGKLFSPNLEGFLVREGLGSWVWDLGLRVLRSGFRSRKFRGASLSVRGMAFGCILCGPSILWNPAVTHGSKSRGLGCGSQGLQFGGGVLVVRYCDICE